MYCRVRRVSAELARIRPEPSLMSRGITVDDRGRRYSRSRSADNSAGRNIESRAASTGCDANGENPFLMAETGEVVGAKVRGVEVGGDLITPRGINSSSSLVVLTRTGDPISNSFDFDPDLEEDLVKERLRVILSLKCLKSRNTGVVGMRGEAEALRVCLTTFGDKKPWTGGYVADFGAHGEGGGMICNRGLAASLHEHGDDFKEAGGTGLRYLSLGSRVKAFEVSDCTRRCPSLGISKTFRRWPGNNGQTVVDGSAGL